MENEFKFGDIVKDTESKVENVVYRVFEDGGVTADTAFGTYGFNGTNVANSYSKQNKYLRNTGRKDLALAIKMQCFYAVKDMERVVELYTNSEISLENMNKLLFENHLFNVKCKHYFK